MDEERVKKAMAAVAQAAAGAAKKRFGPEAMAQVVIALRAGASFEAAARAAGFHRTAINRWRRKSPAFDAACAAAVEAGDVPRLVFRQGGDGTGWQVRKGRRHRFDAARKTLFLEHFAATLDAVGAAEAAGVAFATAYAHRRTDPAFAAAWAEAARIGVERLKEEIGRQRLAAAAAIRVRGDKIVPDAAAEFDKAITFIRTWEGKAAGARQGGPPLTKWSFEDSIAELERRLKAHGVPIEGESDGGNGATGEPDGARRERPEGGGDAAAA